MAQWFLLRDSSGEKSISFSMVVVSFVICSLWLALSVFEQIHGFKIREFDAGAASLWLGPIMTLYFGRRWQSAQKGKEAPGAKQAEPAEDEKE